MPRTAALWVPAFAITLGGCSLLYDFDALGGGDAGDPGPSDGGGDVDGSMDAGDVDPNGPSTPEIEITPATPTTLDDLSVTVTTESVDPLGAEVTYEIAWTVDGAAGATGETVGADLTARDQVWQASVTPVADGRRGAAATASVTIANSAPVAITVGLSSYEPFAGERLEALPYAEDVDGDTLGYSFVWTVDGTPVAGATGASLDLASASVAAGAEVSVSVTASDGDESSGAVAIGPVTVRAATTSWRQIMPNRLGTPLLEASAAAYDADDRRFVWWQEGALFELALVPTQHWARLPVNAGPTIPPALTVLDEGRGRIVVLGGYDIENDVEETRVFVLDLTRGAERWEVLNDGTGAHPALGSGESVTAAYDAEGDRILVYGGGLNRSAYTGELWSLSLESGTWSQIAASGAPGPHVGGALVVTPGERAYLVGGRAWDNTRRDMTGTGDHVYELSLGAGAEAFTLLAGTMPVEMVDAGAVYDPIGARIVVTMGTNADRSANVTSVHAFDVAAKTWSTLRAEPGVLDGARARLSYDPHQDRVLLAGYQSMSVGQRLRSQPFVLDLAALDVRGDATWDAIDVLGQNSPSASTDTGVLVGNELLLFGGRSSQRPDGVAEAWRFRLTEQDFVSVPAPSMPATWGWSHESGILVGAAQMRAATDAGMWRCDASSCTQVPLRAGGVTPTPRAGAVSWRCNNDQYYAFGGHDPDSGDQWAGLTSISCTGGACGAGTLGVPAPAAWGYAAGGRATGSSVFLFGGATGQANFPSAQLLEASACAPSDLAVVTTAGSAPSGRAAATFTFGLHPLGASYPDRMYLFGGTTRLNGGLTLNEVWALDVTTTVPTWNAITPSGSLPPTRRSHAAIWDRPGSRMLVYGGVEHRANVFAGTVYLDRTDLWELKVYE